MGKKDGVGGAQLQPTEEGAEGGWDGAETGREGGGPKGGRGVGHCNQGKASTWRG